MKKLSMILVPVMLVALIITAVGCGGGDDNEITPTPIATAPAPTVTQEPGAIATPIPVVYTGGKHTFKLSHISPAESIGQRQAEYLDELLRRYTDGKVKLEIFPAASLYGSFEMWDALSTGSLDMAFMSDYQFQMAGFSDYNITWINFFWGETMETGGEHNMRFWDHPDGGKKMFAQVEARGVKVLSFLTNNNEIWLVNDSNIKSMHDLKGRKTAGTPGLGGLFVTRAGGIMTIVDPAEFSIAFQQGLIDVYPTGASGVVSYKLYNQACCSFVVDAINTCSFFCMNMNLWNSLEPELQDIIQNKVTPELVAWARVAVPADTAKAKQDVDEKGMAVYYISPEERIEFRDAVWDTAKKAGFLDDIDQDLLKLADQLRSEPYDKGYFFP